MVRFVFSFFIFFYTLTGISQEDYIQPGLIKATATIAPSKMLNRNVGNIYLSGFLEGYLDKHWSLRGDTYLFIDGNSHSGHDNYIINAASRTFFGAFYHTNKNNWDQYIGFQPGLSVIRPLDSTEPGYQAIPSFAIHVGSTYYVYKYFNFYVDLAYVNSTVRGLPSGSHKADELILSAGLGFQIQAKRK